MAFKLSTPAMAGDLSQLRRDVFRMVQELNVYFGQTAQGSGAQISSRVYTEGGVEVCEICVLNGADTHLLKLTASGSQYLKNGTVMWKG